MGFEKLTGMKSSIDFGFSLNLMVEQVPGTFSSTSDLAASPELMESLCQASFKRYIDFIISSNRMEEFHKFTAGRFYHRQLSE
jgi:hypothetical protein